MKRPGRWLRTGAAWLCTTQTMERVIDPVVADVQAEYEEAVRTERWWRAAGICVSGYSAFWKAVSLHTLQSGPRALWRGIAADGWTLGRMIVWSLVAFLIVTLLLAAPPLIGVYPRHQSWLMLTLLDLPQAIALSIPIALPLGVVCGMPGTGLSARRIRGVLLLAIVAMLLALGAMLSIPAADDAYRVALAEELELRGRSYSLQGGPSAMSRSELAARSKHYDVAGLPRDARTFRRAYHIRFAIPAATIVLTLFALGICGTLHGRARRLVVITIAFGVYWAILALAEWNPSVPAIASVWAPNLVFAAISLALLEVRPARGQARSRA